MEDALCTHDLRLAYSSLSLDQIRKFFIRCPENCCGISLEFDGELAVKLENVTISILRTQIAVKSPTDELVALVSQTKNRSTVAIIFGSSTISLELDNYHLVFFVQHFDGEALQQI